MFEFMRDFEGDIPGAAAKDCGNYLDQNLPMAKYLSKRFLDNVLYDIKEDRLVYPQ
jgi:S-ribosylhomocysteine lyase